MSATDTTDAGAAFERALDEYAHASALHLWGNADAERAEVLRLWDAQRAELERLRAAVDGYNHVARLERMLDTENDIYAPSKYVTSPVTGHWYSLLGRIYRAVGRLGRRESVQMKRIGVPCVRGGLWHPETLASGRGSNARATRRPNGRYWTAQKAPAPNA